jgi:hypothetical protein
MKKTTAQLRTAAWDAMEAGRFLEAAELYRQAADAYPSSGALAEFDIENLKAKAASCEACAA